MSLPKDKAWFPAKTHGYGWGMPRCWQGRLVMLGFFLVLFAGTPLIKKSPVYFVGYAGALSVILVAICIWKGEAPSWRWGDDK